MMRNTTGKPIVGLGDLAEKRTAETLSAVRGLDQDPRRRFILEIELAIVRETKATIANERMTTTKENSLPRRGKEGQFGFQTQRLYYQ